MQPWELAMQYRGVPFVHMGRSARGIDCVGLLYLVARDLGLDVIDSPYYGRRPSHRSDVLRLADYLERNFGPPVERPYAANDIVLMRLYPKWPPSHVAIITPHRFGLGMIHTYGEIKRVVHHRVDDHRHKQIVETYSWANIPAKSSA